MKISLLSIIAIFTSLFLILLALSRPYWDLFRNRVIKSGEQVAIHQGDCTYSGPGVTMPSQFNLVGIDVSHHQGLIDWKKVQMAEIGSRPLSFVFVRATYGRWVNDKYFTYNWKATAQLGIHRGAYHYYLAHQSARAQAEKFLSRVCGPNGNYQGELPPVLDIEEMPAGTDREKFHQEIQVWLDLVEKKTGLRPIIYSGSKFYKVNLYPTFKSYPLWIAHYKSTSPSIPNTQTWDLWQFTDKARIDGICEHVDLNVCADVPAFFPKKQLGNLNRNN